MSLKTAIYILTILGTKENLHFCKATAVALLFFRDGEPTSTSEKPVIWLEIYLYRAVNYDVAYASMQLSLPLLIDLQIYYRQPKNYNFSNLVRQRTIRNKTCYSPEEDSSNQTRWVITNDQHT